MKVSDYVKQKAIKEVFGEAGVKGGVRAITKNFLEAAAKSGIKKGVNTALDQMMESIGSATGRDMENKGLLELAFSPLTDNTPDDLFINVNGQNVWPNGSGDHRSIKAGDTLDVGVEYVFDRAKGVSIGLMEYDWASGDDYLGSLDLPTSDLYEAELYDGAMIKSDSEGSLYEVTFLLEPLFAPTEQEETLADAIETVERERKEAQRRYGEVPDYLYGDTSGAAATAQSIADTERAVTGSWKILVSDYKIGDLVFTSDHLVIAQTEPHDFYQVNNENIPRVPRETHTGTWSVAGDGRVRVKFDQPSALHVQNPYSNWYTNFPYAWLPVEIPPDFTLALGVDGKRLYMADRSGFVLPADHKADKVVYATRGYGDNYGKPVGYWDFDNGELGVELQEALLKFRAERGLQAPQAEIADNPKSLAELSADRAAADEKYRIEDIHIKAVYAERERLAIQQQKHDTAFRALLFGMACRQLDAFENKDNLIGSWQVGHYSGEGTKLAAESQWQFLAGGELQGDVGGSQPWEGTWSAARDPRGASSEGVTGCDAAITLDDATATRLGIAAGAQLALGFHENGDKEFFIRDATKGNLALWAIQEVDNSVFAHKYDKIVYTRAQLANNCSPRQPDDAIRQRQQPVGMQLEFTGSGPVEVYKVNFAGANATLLGSVETQSTGAFDGIKGDEFVVLDPDGKCNGLVTTTGTALDERTEFTSGFSRYVSTVDYKETLTPTQVANGCSARLTARSSVGPFDPYTRTRLIWNTGSAPFNMYGLDNFGGVLDPKPLLTVSPGQSGQVMDKEGQTYKVLDGDLKCVAIVGTNWGGNHDFVVGDGSTPITAPTYLTPSQIDNGCRMVEGLRSIRGKFNTSHAVHVANTGPGNLFVHWVGYDGAFDPAHPSVVIPPGTTRDIIDYTGAKYQILDESQKCAAVVEVDFGRPDTRTLGDGTTPVAGQAPVGRAPPQDLTQLERTNGCDTYGQIASTPSTIALRSDASRELFIKNTGSGPLTLNWVSFYGADQNGEETRLTKPLTQIEPGASVRVPNAVDGDAYSVLDSTGRCVAVVRPFNLRKFFDFHDSSSKSANSTWWENGQCANGGRIDPESIGFDWAIGPIDADGKRSEFGASPLIWTFAHNDYSAKGVAKDVSPFYFDGTFTTRWSSFGGCNIDLDDLKDPRGQPLHVQFSVLDDGTKAFVIKAGTPPYQPLIWGRQINGEKLVEKPQEPASVEPGDAAGE